MDTFLYGNGQGLCDGDALPGYSDCTSDTVCSKSSPGTDGPVLRKKRELRSLGVFRQTKGSWTVRTKFIFKFITVITGHQLSCPTPRPDVFKYRRR